MLHGFNISHFRNFDGEPQVVAPLAKINIFIGSNNSGKSNILRYVRDVIAPLTQGKMRDGITYSRENQSRFTTGSPEDIFIYVPLNDEFIKETLGVRSNEFADVKGAISALPTAILGHDVHGIPYKTQTRSNPRISITSALSERVTNSSGLQMLGNRIIGSGQHKDRILLAFYERLSAVDKSRVDPVYVRAFRQIKTRLQQFAHEYELDSGSQDTHIINQIARFANPTYDQQQNLESFDKLRKFIADITKIPDIGIHIPHDFSTINVDIGGYRRPIETLGSGFHELFMLAAEVILNEGKTILLEEPETHLHPEFQRKFLKFLSENVEGQFFITSHSSAIIDTPGAMVFGVKNSDDRSRVELLISGQSRHDACREIGYKPSDLVQSNCIVWVEGPSDRIYLNYLISTFDDALREGIEYSIMFYGGRLASHLTAEETTFEDFIELLPINRRIAIIIDSDLGSPNQILRDTKVRLQNEVNRVGGYCWITEGREMENYVPREERFEAIKRTHPTATELSGSANRFGKPLDVRLSNNTIKDKNFDKVKIAKEAVALRFPLTEFDVSDRVKQLGEFILASNGLD